MIDMRARDAPGEAAAPCIYSFIDAGARATFTSKVTKRRVYARGGINGKKE